MSSTCWMAVNQIFSVKSRIVRESKDEVVIHVTECLWKDMKGWHPGVCAAIGAFDFGLIDV